MNALRIIPALLPAVGVLIGAAPTSHQPGLNDLARAQVSIDSDHERLAIELPAVDLPPGQMAMPSMVDPAPSIAAIPLAVSLYSVHVEVIDSAGNVLPRALLHHFNLTDPGHRDLFLPTSLHVLAASKETPAIDIPPLLLGLPLDRDEQLLATAMLSNTSPVSYHGIRVRVVFGYRATGSGGLGNFFPIFRGYPWVMDVQFPTPDQPAGRAPFDLPPGHSDFSWDGSPAIAGYLLGVGGHVHDYAVGLDFVDMTTGEHLWHATPVRDSAGHIVAMPIARFYSWHSLGVHIEPSHRYRVTATYDNPTGHVLQRAAMGSVAGLFIPDAGVSWPVVDTTNFAYRQDLGNLTHPDADDEMMNMSMR